MSTETSVAGRRRMLVVRRALVLAVLLTVFMSLIVGVAFGGPYFEKKLFNEAGEGLETDVAITPDGDTAFIGDSLVWTRRR